MTLFPLSKKAWKPWLFLFWSLVEKDWHSLQKTIFSIVCLMEKTCIVDDDRHLMSGDGFSCMTTGLKELSVLSASNVAKNSSTSEELNRVTSTLKSIWINTMDCLIPSIQSLLHWERDTTRMPLTKELQSSIMNVILISGSKTLADSVVKSLLTTMSWSNIWDEITSWRRKELTSKKKRKDWLKRNEYEARTSILEPLSVTFAFIPLDPTTTLPFIEKISMTVRHGFQGSWSNQLCLHSPLILLKRSFHVRSAAAWLLPLSFQSTFLLIIVQKTCLISVINVLEHLYLQDILYGIEGSIGQTSVSLSVISVVLLPMTLKPFEVTKRVTRQRISRIRSAKTVERNSRPTTTCSCMRTSFTSESWGSNVSSAAGSSGEVIIWGLILNRNTRMVSGMRLFFKRTTKRIGLNSGRRLVVIKGLTNLLKTGLSELWSWTEDIKEKIASKAFLK